MERSGKCWRTGSIRGSAPGTGMFSGYSFTLLAGRLSKIVLMLFHPDAPPVKDYAFRFQPKPLFQPLFARKRDLPACAHYPMPRQAACRAERPNHLPSTAWEARRARDIAVSGYFAFRYFPNGVANNIKHDTRLMSGVSLVLASIEDCVPSPCERPWCRLANRGRRLRATGHIWAEGSPLRSFAADPRRS